LQTVYRVQHPSNGEGTYGDYDHPEISRIMYAHQNDAHPGPRNWASGMSLTWCTGMIFGFADREQLDEWFKGWKMRLHRAGYVITRWEVDPDQISYGYNQLAFWQEHGKLVETLPMSRNRALTV
jgi:hypothetical protein